MTFLNKVLFTLAAMLLAALPSFSQADSVIAQLSNSGFESFGGSMSGDGRFVVFNLISASLLSRPGEITNGPIGSFSET